MLSQSNKFNNDFLSSELEAVKELSLAPLVKRSDLSSLPKLSERLGCAISLKREDQQQVFSFKIRGAYAKIQSLTDMQRAQGVICASAGNHAQGVAAAASYLGCEATIVMPVITPDIKVEAVKSLGGEVVMYGDNFDEACTEAYRIAEQTGAIFVHPYDDETVIRGQATIALEVYEQCPESDYIFVPIGGGGLAAGIAVVAKALNPNCKVIGVEAHESASMHAAFRADKPVELEKVGRFADGVAVKQVGSKTYLLCRQYIDELIKVSNDEICAAIQDIFEEVRTIAEPAGAIALAGIKRYFSIKPNQFKQRQNVVGILCGANVNFNRLRHVAERADLGENKEAVLAVTIPEVPGSFLTFCDVVGKRNVTEFNYRYSDEKLAHVFVGVSLKQGQSEKQHLIQKLIRAGYSCMDLSANEVAKSHVRYMVGGRVTGVENERLMRFEFPEQPGALLSFLEKMSGHWNISLFHYRNHGSDFGKVLMGIQVPEKDNANFNEFLKRAGFVYQDETQNPAYQLFL